MSTMTFLGLTVLVVISIVVGILIGRANPKKADIIARYADKAKDGINTLKK